MITLKEVTLTPQELHNLCWQRTKKGNNHGFWLSSLSVGKTIHEKIEHRKSIKNISEPEKNFDKSFIRKVHTHKIMYASQKAVDIFLKRGIENQKPTKDIQYFYIDLLFYKNKWIWAYVEQGIFDDFTININKWQIPKGSYVKFLDNKGIFKI